MSGYPSKRRKTCHVDDMLNPQAQVFIPMQRRRNAPEPRPTWPPSIVPLEIFAEVMSYLPRSTILNMRLVNKEFEKKLLAYLFRVVVVPFKPEIYGITPEPPLGGYARAPEVMSKGGVMLLDKGMRVFSGFGHHIQKFALSFEIDENNLTNPPLKNEQEAITTFWGIHRWPYQRYNRYAQLEGLEMTADETRTMSMALRHLIKVKELGLSIDGGLGWLAGPDVNARVNFRMNKPAVFGPPSFVAEPRAARAAEHPQNSSVRSVTGYTLMERMLRESGYTDATMAAAVSLMLETENPLAGTASSTSLLNSLYAFCADTASQDIDEEAPGSPNDARPGPRALADTIVNENVDPYTIAPPSLDQHGNAVDRPDRTVSSYNGMVVEAGRTARLPAAATKKKSDLFSLKPNDLSNAQKEMLLETEWAQRAFMQSYTIAVIDNPATFQHVTTFTIARLPYRHLSILRRNDFWIALPNVSKLSLAVIPDWRDVTKLPTSFVQDVKLAPSLCITGVYQLLCSQITHRKNIKTLHFEWLCGGEYASGIFARNKHILAAPFVPEAMDMVARNYEYPLLEFPHLEHLSLKNCWLTPHMMSRFTFALKAAGCKRMTFESVSLSASVALNALPGPLTAHAAAAAAVQANLNNVAANLNNAALGAHQLAMNINNNAMAMAPPVPLFAPAPNAGPGPGLVNLNLPNPAVNGPQQQNNAFGIGGAGNLGHWPGQLPPLGQQFIPVVAPQAPMPPQGVIAANSANSMPDWLDTPRVGSWAALIDKLTPAETLADRRYSWDFGPEPAPRLPSALVKLDFDSCGYVRLPLDFDQSAIESPELATMSARATRRSTDLEAAMLKPPASDVTLGTIVNFINPVEEGTLENVFNMTVGWDADKADLFSDSREDGVMNAGLGRFSGVLEI